MPYELEKRCLEARLTRPQLAERADVSLYRLHKLASGWGGGVSIDAVQRLASVLNCDPSDISEVLEPDTEGAA